MIRHQTPPNPYRCRWCGIALSDHGCRWVASRGMHAWEQPTRQQILARMRARRTARLTSARATPEA